MYLYFRALQNVPECSLLPESTGAVPEGLPLCWEVTISGWNAKEEGIVLCEGVCVADSWDVGVLPEVRLVLQ